VRFDFALLADAAQVVEAKLYVQGGGLTRLTATSVPWMQPLAVCMRLAPDPDDDLGREWQFEVAVLGPEENAIFAHRTPVTLRRPAIAVAEGEQPSVLLAVTLGALMFHGYGPHRVTLALDGAETELPFVVVPPEAPGP
jgi:hypothetical protein